MKIYISLIFLWTAVWLFPSCTGGGRTAFSLSDGDTLPLQYATNLTLVSGRGYQIATLRNPWDTLKILHTYILVDRNAPLPDSLPQGTVIRVPLQKSVVYSSVHCGLLKELGALSAIKGICDLEYINLPEIREGCRTGRVADLGNSMSPDIEKIIQLHPDAILLSPFENGGGYGRLDKLDISIVECADYMETSPLGRAEWMRFFGLLYGKAREADSLFNRVATRYRTLAGRVADAPGKPKVFTDEKSGSAWYVPGGRSTVGRLLADAGADYVFSYLDMSGSSPLSFETVYDKAKDADIWLIRYNAPTDKTYGELKRDFAPYAGFKAFRERQIYGCNLGKVPYYEETPFHPEYLLEDLIRVFHPDMEDAQKTRYFSRLKE
ncbi:MAG: ABC transporter substrate-binding protein [Paraprevotella sp.]|nr:ABC transporter substrate-binding protein [Paraprevotella sp.]